MSENLNRNTEKRLRTNFSGGYRVKTTEAQTEQATSLFDNLLKEKGQLGTTQVAAMASRLGPGKLAPAIVAEVENGKNLLKVMRLTSQNSNMQGRTSPFKASLFSLDKKNTWQIQQSLLFSGSLSDSISLPAGREGRPTTQDEVQERFEAFMLKAAEIVQSAKPLPEQAQQVGSIALN